MTTRRRHHDEPRVSGFTMIEILVVILIVGLATRIVYTNMGAWIPESVLNAQSAKLRSWVDYLRSEAKVQGKPYGIELDLEENATQLILPPEDKLVTTEEDTIASAIPLGWTPLEKGVVFHGHSIAGREIRTKGKVLITFDANGFSADQSVYFRHVDEEANMVWSVHIHGLSGTTEVVTDYEGTRAIFKAAEESDF